MATCRQANTRLSSALTPIRAGSPRDEKTITVQAGHTYSYTAAWSGTNLVLVMNQGQTVLPQSAY